MQALIHLAIPCRKPSCLTNRRKYCASSFVESALWATTNRASSGNILNFLAWRQDGMFWFYHLD